MLLTDDVCYLAVASRDARFDGRFFTGVTTTGIYCRPVCPSRTPRREHTRFFRCAAEAESAGFRPCLRCRPETAPGSPAWTGTRATVSQALRLLSAGYLDEHRVDELAGRLGMGDRHLRRLFLRHLGVTPVQVAQTRRIHFARSLLADSGLAISDVAFASGFGSLRRFNALFRKLYQQSPTALREKLTASTPKAESPLELRLRFRPPYAWQAMLRFLAPRATPGVEAVSGGVYRRSVVVDGAQGLIEVTLADSGDCLLLRLFSSGSRGLIHVVDRARRLFDLSADPAEINAVLGRDEPMAALVRAEPGLRVPGAWDGFELAVRAILGQQVSVAAATGSAGLLAERYGEPLAEPARGLTRLFPSAARLAEADPADLRLPRTRANAVVHLARAVASGELRFEPYGDLDQAVARLTALPGVGEWTAQYVAMRALGEPDAFPASDLGLLRAAGRWMRLATPASLEAKAEEWRPWRSYAAMHLWHSLGSRAQARAASARAASQPSRRAGRLVGSRG